MHKNKVKMTKDLNIRYDTIKLLEESIGKSFSDINHTNVFLGRSPKVVAKVNKWDLIKLLSFCTGNETNKQKKETAYGLGGNICKLCYRQELNVQNIQTAHTI